MSEHRRQLVMNYEGQALQVAGQRGEAAGAWNACCLIDGAANALIRMRGPEAAAEFIFALQDRVVARVRAPTSHALIATLEVALETVPVAAPPTPPVSSTPEPPAAAPMPLVDEPPSASAPAPTRPMRFWMIFGVGWLVGLVHAAAFMGNR